MVYRSFRIAAGILIIAAFIFTITTNTASASRPARQSASEIDTYIDKQMLALDIPGVAIGIVRGNELVYTQGYGIAGDGATMTAATPFLIASLSKSFTAMAIMQLAEQGSLDLDAPVQTYLPWFKVEDEAASSRITIRHLLYQTSGFSEREGYIRNLESHQTGRALEESIRKLETASLNSEPGEAFEYSNTNYDILGLVIQTVSGQPYEAYIEAKIFAPLEMHRSYTTLEDAREGGLARGHYPLFGFPIAMDPILPYSGSTRPSAGLFSSAEDLTHFLVAHLNDGDYHGRQILSPAGMAELLTPGVQYSDNAGYAMGWAAFPFKEVQQAAPQGVTPTGIAHRGDWLGYYSMMVLIPELETGIVMLMNLSNPARAPELFNLGWSLCTLALGLEPLPPGSETFLGRNILALLGAVILLLAAGLAWSWRKLSSLSPGAPPGRRLALQMSLLAILDGLLAGGLLFIRLPENNDTLALALRFTPDIGLLYLVVLGLALGWGSVRTVWFLLRYRREKPVVIPA